MKTKRTVFSMFVTLIMVITAVCGGLQIEISAAYEPSAADVFVSTPLDTSRATTYDGSDKEKSFNMNGRTYYQGLAFDETSYDSSVSYNVTDIDNITFTIGHVDDKRSSDASLTIYLDDEVYDTVSLTWRMKLLEYEADVSPAKKMTLVLNRNGYSSYALADFTVDSVKSSQKYTVPKYTSSEDFYRSGFSESYVTYADNTSDEPSFYMNGRGFYDGVVFDDTSYDSEISFNVEKVKKLSFSVGHVDNKRTSNARIIIYLDNKEYDTVDLHSTMNLLTYEADVSKASTILMILKRNGYASYALADFKVDSLEPTSSPLIPEYSSAKEFLQSGFEKSSVSIVDSAAKNPEYYMNGRGFYEGIVLDETSYDSCISFNVENINELSFTIGHVDNKSRYNSDMIIYLDEKEFDTIPLHYTMNLKEYSIDLTNIKTLRIYIKRNGYSSYAIGDVNIDGLGQARAHTVPKYSDAEGFIESGFDISSITTANTASKNPSYYINGKGYYDGFVFDETSYDSTVRYNVENIGKLSFTVGHVDDKNGSDATLAIYYDDEEAKKLALKGDMVPEDIELDLSNVSVLRLTVIRNGYSSYGIGNVSIVTKKAETKPAVTTTKTTTTTITTTTAAEPEETTAKTTKKTKAATTAEVTTTATTAKTTTPAAETTVTTITAETTTIAGNDYTGTCGADLTWHLNDGTGILTISGTGDMVSTTASYFM